MSAAATGESHSAVSRTARAGLAVLLGTVALKGLFTDLGWLIDVGLTIAVVLGPAMLIRLRRPPGALDIWPGVILMIPWLTLRFVPAHAHLGFLPGRASLHDVSTMITTLHHISQHEVAPIQSTPEVRLVLCALIGLLAALVDLLAVVGRRGALAGVPLLVIYTVSGAVPRKAVAWPWFVVAACGFLLLLSLDTSDARARWGRRLAAVRSAGPAEPASVLSRSASRVGAIAIAVAIIVPLAVPVPSTNLLAKAFHTGKGQPGFGARSGSGGSISPFALLRDQLNRGKPQNIASVTIEDSAPSVVPFYLRVNVLDKYTAKGWVEGSHGSTEAIQQSNLQTEPGNDYPRSDQFTARITIDGLTGNAPLFAAATRITGLSSGTRWSADDQLLLDGTVSRGQRIIEAVNQPAPTLAQLAAAPAAAGPDVAHWLVKPTLPSYVTRLVARLTAKADGPYARALAISNYFADPSSGFTYSTRSPVGDSGSELVDFLVGKRGFCQQFAAAMAIMLRQAGVPSRVVLGYEHRPENGRGEFTVTTDDAHAWVEAYFTGIGWIPFDPTPPAGLTGGPQSDLVWAPHNYGPGAQGNTEPGLNKPGQAKTSAAAAPSSSSAAPPVAATATPGGGSIGWPTLVGWLIAAAALLLALIPAAVRAGRRRRRLRAGRAGDADALWAELCDTALDLGLGWSQSRSPRQVAAWLSRVLGRPDSALDQLAAAVEQHRFGPSGRTTPHPAEGRIDSPARGLVAGLRQVSGELRVLRSWRTRLSARLWPRSLELLPGRLFGRGPVRANAGGGSARRH